ncbi:Branched-chain amino acid transport ATP-binding protein LivG [Streptomyces venezuelae]|uniref:ABC transporter ATP-binding protein n=1 Tax=Streptomyces gardneri TaxID=66892 RepID=UPI0006BCF4CE|nr:ABC transporter ATP-binding protein [Streptomyces gardneri]ALO07625.1 Branched-chain amino acid transport ATP-binding protein LivG [Streptomyces venezuelae]QPK44935.1 ATP-binding cassette domain-containing protein [Streptomyces gardneri]WRK36249.1 ATP-binding cassette domain-containing protein [Streptomyces venezuelae]CUM42046.1 Branched-chain amino acid transport ATP-binding protein LivG (TC 3.A.1.4.1) [Streptomyces venezuelae]
MTTTTKTADATTAPTAGEAVLDARGVTMRFGGLTAVRDVNLTVNSGEIVGLIGPNGAGKTTFFNCLTGLYVPTEGEVRYKGQVLPPTSYKVTDAGIARTFQNIRLFHNMTVLENVLVGRHTRMKQGLWSALLRLPGFKKAEAEATERAMELLEFIGLQDKAQHLAKNLPYGEQRKLEIARALASDPGLILLDEPTAGMNPQETRAAEELIFAIRDMGVAVLVIEHDMRFIFNLCDRVAVLVQGQKLIEGDSQTVQSDERVIAAYLGEPVAESTPEVEAPAEEAPAKDAPAKDAPAEDASSEDEATEDEPSEDESAEDEPAEDAPEAADAPESSEDTPHDPASGKENDA